MLYDPKWEETVTPPVIEEPWRKLCSRAAEVIRQYGWIKHEPGNVQVGFCVIGALLYAFAEANDPAEGSAKSNDYLLAKSAILRTLTSLGIFGDGIPHWNDKRAMYQEDVINVLELAAKSPE